MLPTHEELRRRLEGVVRDKTAQGHVTEGLDTELERLRNSYDALWAFGERLAQLPLRTDWPYVEPDDLDAVEREMGANRPRGRIRAIANSESRSRIEAAFSGSVAGCIVGKPLEVNPTLYEIRDALTAIGEWPLSDYVSERLDLRNNRSFHHSWTETCRERIRYAAADDDINYTILGMLVLERYGFDFTHDDLRQIWLHNIPPYWSWGPERTFIVTAALRTFDEDWKPREAPFFERIQTLLNPGEEWCGAMIRADAYGYASAGNPELAARLAHRDASLTHRRTGVYGTMFAAAAIAAAAVARSPIEIFEIALGFVPRKSRFYHIVADSLEEVSRAKDWLDGYDRIHGKYAQYAHCRVFQESGTLINTLRFAENVGDGICKQVMQGNDTDSYGATSGSILGMYFGKAGLDERWLRPFNDTLYSTLAEFHEQRLSAIVERMGRLAELSA